MILKKSKIKIPYIRLDFRIVRQSDVRCCERTAVSHRLLLDCHFAKVKIKEITESDVPRESRLH